MFTGVIIVTTVRDIRPEDHASESDRRRQAVSPPGGRCDAPDETTSEEPEADV